MCVQIVMDRSGDTRHEFDTADKEAVALAEQRFHELTGKGFRAVALGRDGSPGNVGPGEQDGRNIDAKCLRDAEIKMAAPTGQTHDCIPTAIVTTPT